MREGGFIDFLIDCMYTYLYMMTVVVVVYVYVVLIDD